MSRAPRIDEDCNVLHIDTIQSTSILGPATVLAFETDDVLQAWALPIENIIGVCGFVLVSTIWGKKSFMWALVRDIHVLAF